MTQPAKSPKAKSKSTPDLQSRFKSKPKAKNEKGASGAVSGMLSIERAKKLADKPVKIAEVVGESQVVKDTRRNIKKAQKKTEDFVKGEDKAPDTKAPRRIKAKSLRNQRNKVLQDGKKFIYPLRSAKHRVATISAAIGLVIILGIGLVSYLLLYKVQTTSDVSYRLTQIVPFPVGKVNDETVRYEEYLFELNNATHFIENFENVNFSTDEGHQQLEQIKLQVRDKVVENAVVRQLAEQNNITVSDEELQAEVEEFRRQNGVVEETEDQTDKLLESIRTTYDWDLDDFERELELQILKQKLIPVLDTKTQQQADKAFAELEGGAEFKDVAKKYTEDSGTEPTGGEFPEPIQQDNSDLPRLLVETGFGLSEGEYSGPIQTVFEGSDGKNTVALHLVTNFENVDSTSRRLGHIVFLYDSFGTVAKQQLEDARANANFYIDFFEEVEGTQEDAVNE